MTAKATYKGKSIDRWTGKANLFYEYKGQTYMVTDHGWNCPMGEELWRQHKTAQRAIDEEIVNGKNVNTAEPTGDAEEALDELFKFWEEF